jgi:phosphatidate cytidylyltransferase
LLIISNDVWAYFFGFFWGRTPLIQLSPKKTWEGFLGGFLMTVITGFFLSRFLAQFTHLICPQYDFWAWRIPDCSANLALPFQMNRYRLPLTFLQTLWKPIAMFVSTDPTGETIGVMPVQWHGVGLGIFASVIAPFGGFFASGFKRAFKFKDFGDLIPGHGGVTDRMDCQIMMGMFVHVYYNAFVR